jgi:hypothetical protein
LLPAMFKAICVPKARRFIVKWLMAEDKEVI